MSLRDYLFHEEPGITLYCGDCRDVLPLLESADLVLTDPPYEGEAHTLQRRVKREGGVMEVEPLTFSPLNGDSRYDYARAIALRASRWVLTFCQIEASQRWVSAYEVGGLYYKRTCIWVKPDGMPQWSGDRPGMGYETIVAMHSPGRSEWNGGGQHGVFTHRKNSGGAHEHPTMKPLPLITELIGLFSQPGYMTTVLDPFAGSGTTLEAAKLLGRRAIGIEIEPKYCEIAVKRLRQEVLPLTKRTEGKGAA